MKTLNAFAVLTLSIFSCLSAAETFGMPQITVHDTVAKPIQYEFGDYSKFLKQPTVLKIMRVEKVENPADFKDTKWVSENAKCYLIDHHNGYFVFGLEEDPNGAAMGLDFPKELIDPEKTLKEGDQFKAKIIAMELTRSYEVSFNKRRLSVSVTQKPRIAPIETNVEFHTKGSMLEADKAILSLSNFRGPPTKVTCTEIPTT